MRVFFAVDFDDELRRAIAHAIDGIGIAEPPWRWVATANFHITLKFLGDVDDDRIDALITSAERAARTATPFDITLRVMGGFPNLRKPRVLFYKVDQGVEPLTALANGLDLAIEEDHKIPRERRPFRAHATIARVKSPPNRDLAVRLEGAPPVESPPQTVRSIQLMKSVLGRQGAVYHRLKDIALPETK